MLDVATKLRDVDFLLVGGGDQFDGVREKSRSLGNVMLTGMLPHDETAKAIAKMDLCLIPYNRNRQTDRISPVKLFEYWAMGKPVVSTRCYEIERIGHDRVLFADDADELSKLIVKLRDDKGLRHELARKGMEEVVKYDWKLLGRIFSDRLAGPSMRP